MEKLQGLAQKKINIKTERTAEEISAIKERTKAALAAAVDSGALKLPERTAARGEVAAQITDLQLALCEVYEILEGFDG